MLFCIHEIDRQTDRQTNLAEVTTRETNYTTSRTGNEKDKFDT